MTTLPAAPPMQKFMGTYEIPDVILQETARPAPPAVHALVERLREQFGSSLIGILFYGSCRRGVDPYEGLIDLYVIVDALRPHCSRLSAVLGWLLPPNVSYLEVPSEGRVARCKYALVSLARFRHGIERRFHPYFWARFAQPTSIVWSRDEPARKSLVQALAAAPKRLWHELGADAAHPEDPLALWREGFRHTYKTELRVEHADQASKLVDANRHYYLGLSAMLAQASPQGRGRTATLRSLRWTLRNVHGKLISVLRLLKGGYTFEGGLEYLVWKLERHTGERVEVPNHVRKWPFIFAWWMIWRLYRDGVLR